MKYKSAKTIAKLPTQQDKNIAMAYNIQCLEQFLDAGDSRRKLLKALWETLLHAKGLRIVIDVKELY